MNHAAKDREHEDKKTLSFALRKKSLFLYKSPLVDAFQEKKIKMKNIMNMNTDLRLNVSFQ